MLPKSSLFTPAWNFLSENLDKPNNPKEETFPVIKKYPPSGSQPAQSVRRKGHKLLLSSTVEAG